jgi:hypothetical protein
LCKDNYRPCPSYRPFSCLYNGPLLPPSRSLTVLSVQHNCPDLLPCCTLTLTVLHIGSENSFLSPGSSSIFVIMGSDAFAIENRKDLVVVVNVVLSFSTLSALSLRFAKVTGNAKQRKFDAQNIMICLAGVCMLHGNFSSPTTDNSLTVLRNHDVSIPMYRDEIWSW